MVSDARFSPNFEGIEKDSIFYALTMFPYPSGSGLHCGHASVFTINDVVARWKRMKGFTVFNPFGFDAFGLPTENYAIKLGKPAYKVTEDNKKNFLGQLEGLDISFDRSRVIDTSSPDYYKWTQWVFSQLYKNGLVYRDELRVNWCPDCQTVLANDQVVEGSCERCKNDVVQKKHPQRFIKITDYADRLLSDLDDLDRPEETKIAQRNRIGRSEGAKITFIIDAGDKEESVEVFTTRPDTIYGVTGLVFAPEISKYDEYIPSEMHDEVERYRQIVLAKTSVERQKGLKEKTGVFSGMYAIHPLTGDRLPIWFADYVLADYGSGAVMSVPSHDQRDFDFATKFGIPKKQVIAPYFVSQHAPKKDFPTVKRQTVCGIIEHREEEKFLCLDREKLQWRSLVMGGVDERESDKTSLLREISEETGYIDSHIQSQIGGEVHSSYFAGHKNENRYAYETCYHVKLQSGATHDNQLDDEHHSFVWLSKEEVSAYLTTYQKKNPHSHFWEMYLGGDHLEKNGVLINSGPFDGKEHSVAIGEIIDYLEEKGVGKKSVTYKLRDRSISRQRYRGSPIPIYYDENNQPHLIPEDELPVVLPLDLKNYKPTGKSPLEDHPTFPQYVAKDGKIYRRECDTLDTFMCSSFYFLRYPDSSNSDELISKDLADKLFPIPLYSGGKEHTVGHLLYSRFVHKFLFDCGYLSSKEPFQKLIHQGMVLGSDGRKMGKRYGNGIDPVDVISKYGSDAVRLYLMFMGPVDQDKAWNDGALHGMTKFLRRIEALFDQDRYGNESAEVDSICHETIRGVDGDLEKLKLNTAVSKLMIFVNTIYEKRACSPDIMKILSLLISVFAPNIAQNIRNKIGLSSDVAFELFPLFDPSKILVSQITLPVQVNGKVRGKISIAAGLSQDEVLEAAMAVENIKKRVGDASFKKVIWVQDKILNLVC